MVSKELSLIMGERLKKERVAKKLSHSGLSDAIYEKYGVRIARDSLINYEVSTEHHSKSFKNNGMRVEYLRYLADFFEVSTDWLLGISDTRTQNAEVSQIGNSTGLSSKAVENLIELKNQHPAIEAYNFLLENKSLLKLIVNYLVYFALKECKNAPYKHIPIMPNRLFPHMPSFLFSSVLRQLEQDRTRFEKLYADDEEFKKTAILDFLFKNADFDECKRYIDTREYERAVASECGSGLFDEEYFQSRDEGYPPEPEEERKMASFNALLEKENKEEDEKEQAIKDFLALAGQ